MVKTHLLLYILLEASGGNHRAFPWWSSLRSQDNFASIARLHWVQSQGSRVTPAADLLEPQFPCGRLEPKYPGSQARIFQLRYQHHVPPLPFRNVFMWTRKGHGSSKGSSEVCHYQSTLLLIFHFPAFLIREQVFSGKELNVSCPLTSSTISSI